MNPNTNPNFPFSSLHHPPNPNPPPPDLSLSTTLSSLTNLLSLSHQTLNSLSSPNYNFTLPKKTQHELIPCPFNPNHLMPPEPLFSHTLHCPSPLNLTHSLNYQNTLNPSPNLHFTQKLDNPNNIQELCFSLDEYINFGSNFFYKDCPGVVNLSGLDTPVNRTFSLPGFLSIECENFVGVNEAKITGFDRIGFKFLVSDLLEIKKEILLWSDYPNGFSFNVCYAISRLNLVKVCDFKRWVIANSPRFGVVIDVYMRDHICVVFRLCLKAIVKEGFGLVNRDFLKGGNLKCVSFKCPVLVQVLMWLASQLSVLFGEVNGKFFAIDMIKHCVLEAARGLLLFPLEEKEKEKEKEKFTGFLNLKGSDENLDSKGIEIKEFKLDEPNDRRIESEIDRRVGETVVSGGIFVSQVAAAVAALHERSLLEEKIKTLRYSQPLPRYQRYFRILISLVCSVLWFIINS